MSAEAQTKIYHDPKDPGFLNAVERLLRRAKQLNVLGTTRHTLQENLRIEKAYTLHKKARRRFTRNNTYFAGIDAQWQVDLADMPGISKQNGGMRYFLTVIDVFSKFAWAIPVHSTDAKAITAAFGQILKTVNQRLPPRLQTDKGKEFINSDFKAMKKRNGIQHLSSESEQNAAVVERFNRTIKTRWWTYLSDHGTVRWVYIIQDLFGAYNHSRHRSIGMAPADLQKQDVNRLWVRLFEHKDTHLKPKIPQGAMVQASSHKTLFDKGNMSIWTNEHFIVSQAIPPKRGTKRRVYKLMDYNDEPVKGSWYPEEQHKISDIQYLIEKVLWRRTLPDGTKELFVRWKVWAEKNNSWIKEQRLVRCRSWVMSSRSFYQAMYRAIQETNQAYMRLNLKSLWIYLANGM